jgi:hypothetical protein
MLRFATQINKKQNLKKERKKERRSLLLFLSMETGTDATIAGRRIIWPSAQSEKINWEKVIRIV